MSLIESTVHDELVFPPPADLAARAAISGTDAYRSLIAEAAHDYEGFWARLARETVTWRKPFSLRSTRQMHRSTPGSRTAS